MKAFGIGSLHFSFKGGEEKEITVQEYVDEVRATLERLSNVSDVDIYFDEDVINEKVDISESTHMNDGDPCHPHIPFFELTFNLYLPLRVQAEVINRDQNYIHTETESFRVVFKHDWHGPFAVVELIGASENSSPSTAIQIVREYLKREIDSSGETLQLDYVGPSPFHADFFLNERKERLQDKVSNFELDHIKVPGYDRLIFSYLENQYESLDLAFEELISELSSEVAFFYELKILHAKRSTDWDSIQSSLHELLEIEDESHKKTFKDRYSNKPRLLNSLYRDIGLFKGQEIYYKNIYEQHYFSIYKTEKHNVYLKTFVDASLENWTTYPIKETSEIVGYFQNRSNKSLELSVVMLAAILGGTIGAFITVLFGS